MSAGKRPHVLVVDDDPGIRQALSTNLEARGYRVSTAANGLEAMQIIERERPELLLLDIMMPRLDGLEVCRRVRERDRLPIVILSAKGGEEEVVAALDLGADDYLVKPFRLEELFARIRAVLRRIAEEQPQHRLHCRDLVVDFSRRLVSVGGQEVPLTPIEYAVLTELARNAGRVLTNRLILQRVWGPEYMTETDYVKGVIRRLRLKIEPDPANPVYIRTETRVGYRLYCPDAR